MSGEPRSCSSSTAIRTRICSRRSSRAADPTAFDVARATDARRGDVVAARRASALDCAVVDLGLPDAEALAIIETLAARSPAVALVALTGRDDDELGVATIEAGASDYLSKSALDGKLLVRCIRHAVLRKRFEIVTGRRPQRTGAGRGGPGPSSAPRSADRAPEPPAVPRSTAPGPRPLGPDSHRPSA